MNLGTFSTAPDFMQSSIHHQIINFLTILQIKLCHDYITVTSYLPSLCSRHLHISLEQSKSPCDWGFQIEIWNRHNTSTTPPHQWVMFLTLFLFETVSETVPYVWVTCEDTLWPHQAQVQCQILILFPILLQTYFYLKHMIHLVTRFYYRSRNKRNNMW